MNFLPIACTAYSIMWDCMAAAGGIARVQQARARVNKGIAAGLAVLLNQQLPPPQPRYEETPLFIEAKELLCEITRELDDNDRPLLHRKIHDLIVSLKLGKKEKTASDLEKAGWALSQCQSQGKENDALLKERIKAVHDICLTIMEGELPQAVKAPLLKIKNIKKYPRGDQEWDGNTSVINETMSRLSQIFSGSIFDLPLPKIASQQNAMTISEFCTGRSEMLMEMARYREDLSQHEKETIIFSSLFLNRGRRRVHAYGDISVVEFFLKKGANFSHSHRYTKELRKFLSHLANRLVNDLEQFKYIPYKYDVLSEFYLERMIFSGYDIRGLNGGQTFFQMLEWHFTEHVKADVRQQHREALFQTYACAIDHGADLREVISPEKIESIRESIRRGKISWDQYGVVKTKDEYLLPREVEAWEFQLVQRLNRNFYLIALANVRAKRMAAKIAAEGVVEGSAENAVADAAADRGSSQVERDVFRDIFREEVDRALKNSLIDAVVDIVDGYVRIRHVDKEVALEVQRLREKGNF